MDRLHYFDEIRELVDVALGCFLSAIPSTARIVGTGFDSGAQLSLFQRARGESLNVGALDVFETGKIISSLLAVAVGALQYPIFVRTFSGPMFLCAMKISGAVVTTSAAMSTLLASMTLCCLS